MAFLLFSYKSLCTVAFRIREHKSFMRAGIATTASQCDTRRTLSYAGSYIFYFVFASEGYLDPIPSYYDILTAPKARTSRSGYLDIGTERSVMPAASRGLSHFYFNQMQYAKGRCYPPLNLSRGSRKITTKGYETKIF